MTLAMSSSNEPKHFKQIWLMMSPNHALPHSGPSIRTPRKYKSHINVPNNNIPPKDLAPSRRGHSRLGPLDLHPPCAIGIMDPHVSVRDCKLSGSGITALIFGFANALAVTKRPDPALALSFHRSKPNFDLLHLLLASVPIQPFLGVMVTGMPVILPPNLVDGLFAAFRREAVAGLIAV